MIYDVRYRDPRGRIKRIRVSAGSERQAIGIAMMARADAVDFGRVQPSKDDGRAAVYYEPRVGDVAMLPPRRRDPREPGTYETIGTATSLAGLQKLVDKYFYITGYKIHPTTLKITSPSNIVPTGVIITRQGGTYVFRKTKDGSRDHGRARRLRRDPPEPGEYERHQKMPMQRVVFRMVFGQVVALFPNLRKGKADDRRMSYTMRGGKNWVTRDDMTALMRSARKTTPAEEKPVLNHLVFEHGYPINGLRAP